MLNLLLVGYTIIVRFSGWGMEISHPRPWQAISISDTIMVAALYVSHWHKKTNSCLLPTTEILFFPKLGVKCLVRAVLGHRLPTSGTEIHSQVYRWPKQHLMLASRCIGRGYGWPYLLPGSSDADTFQRWIQGNYLCKNIVLISEVIYIYRERGNNGKIS